MSEKNKASRETLSSKNMSKGFCLYNYRVLDELILLHLQLLLEDLLQC
jgi:hypothetical protein